MNRTQIMKNNLFGYLVLAGVNLVFLFIFVPYLLILLHPFSIIIGVPLIIVFELILWVGIIPRVILSIDQKNEKDKP